jgi:uncharacterized membrane protein required for colicin V production
VHVHKYQIPKLGRKLSQLWLCNAQRGQAALLLQARAQNQEVPVNELDLIIIFIVFIGAFIGWRRGLVRVFISIFGIFVTVIVVGYLYELVGDIVSRSANRIGIGLGITQAEILVYIVSVIVMTAIVELLSRNTFEGTRIQSLGVFDNVLGALVGIIYGLLWASLLLAPAQYSVTQTGDTWRVTLFGATLVPALNSFFQHAVLDVVNIFFTGGVPKLYRNQVTAELSFLFLNLGSPRI